MTPDSNDSETHISSKARLGPQPKAKRFWLICAGILALSLAAGTLLYVISDTREQAKTDSTTADEPNCVKASPSSNTGTTTPLEEPPQTGGIEIIDEGFSPSEPEAKTIGLNAGVVVKNTSDYVARNITIHIDMLEPTGERLHVLGDGSKEWQGTKIVVPYILPDTTFGMGTEAQVMGTKSDLTIENDVQVEEWWPRDNGVHNFGKLIAKPMSRNEQFKMGRITLTSNYCRPVKNARLGVIYRDAEGNIIGGNSREFAYKRAKEEQYREVHTFEPGQSELFIRGYMPLTHRYVTPTAEPDPTKTEIYPYWVPEEDQP